MKQLGQATTRIAILAGLLLAGLVVVTIYPPHVPRTEQVNDGKHDDANVPPVPSPQAPPTDTPLSQEEVAKIRELIMAESFNNQSFLAADLEAAKGHLTHGPQVRLGDPPTDLNRRGFITKVGSTGRLIEISLGDDDGMRIGRELFVYREATFLGKAVIRETSADFAVAEVEGEVALVRGDQVATKQR
ncbi:MAG: hypothetical protein KDB14_18550 [Planctomycetales bacterium]|nr:hypothetical protein [Planctomycetales bacterium]